MLTLGSKIIRHVSRRSLSSTKYHYAFWASNKLNSNNNSVNSSDVPPNLKNNELPLKTSNLETQRITGITADKEKHDILQAPNRASVWSRSQNPRAQAMSGPRFEQTLFEFQPAPLSAIELSHQQPVKWVREKVVSCDGGGGPLGHPRIFINTDKPEICVCEYCGKPFVRAAPREY